MRTIINILLVAALLTGVFHGRRNRESDLVRAENTATLSE